MRTPWRALIEISFRLLQGRGRGRIDVTTWISIGGLVLGVACLTVSMGVMSGFETTLQKALSETSGHIQVFRFRMNNEPLPELTARIEKILPELVGSTPFLSVEGVLAHGGRVQGVFLQGLESSSQEKVLNLKPRLIVGELDFEDSKDLPPVLLGQVLAERFGLKPGDSIRLLVPQPSEFDPHEFRRKLGTFRVAGILELGKYEYDERMILMPLAALQRIADVGGRESGLLLKVGDAAQARKLSQRLAENLGTGFRVRDWRDVNENIFEAIALEKVVIFFVIFIIVIASAFNVATSLFVQIVRKYPEIAVLKAMGCSTKQMMLILTTQGFLLGIVGSAVGIVLGFGLGAWFEWAQVALGVIPREVYRIGHVDVSFRWTDLTAIASTTILICGLATWSPARKGALQSPVEGLRYE